LSLSSLREEDELRRSFVSDSNNATWGETKEAEHAPNQGAMGTLERILENSGISNTNVYVDSVVTTFKEEDVRKTIDVSEMSDQDLTDLKEDDLFSFYSIPAVREAAMRDGQVDLQSVLESTLSSGECVFERKSCVSFESRDLFLDAIFDTIEDDDVVND
jgi:hypothetical protein